MGAPASGIKGADQPAAETLLTAFKTIDAAERRRHASVVNYWLSIRGDKEFPPLHDLDPLELSDAGPNSGLFELISGGHDAEIRHLGEALRDDDWPERIMDAPSPSLLACIARKLPIVAISRDFLAFEDEFEGDEGKTRCWVTLLPLSAGGAWVDYVYALVSLDKAATKVAGKKTKEPDPEIQGTELEIEESLDAEDLSQDPEESADEPAAISAEASEAEQPVDAIDEDEIDEAAAGNRGGPGFSRILDSLAGLTGFYGSQPVRVDPVVEPEQSSGEPPAANEQEEPAPDVEEEAVVEPEQSSAEPPAANEQEEQVPDVEEAAVADEPVVRESATLAEEHARPTQEHLAPAEEHAEADKRNKSTRQSAVSASEGSLQNKLAQVRAEADEARQAKLRANVALYEALSAAYDFALDAEETPEEYLRLVEAQGLKIQLRSPMKPVVKLAFEGMCDEPTIKQLEAVLAWAFDQELPRGALAEQIEAAGGIGPILGGQAKAA